MKHQVVILALLVFFLMLSNQSLAQETSSEILTPIQKTVLCGPASEILLNIKKSGEKPNIIFQNPVNNTQTLVFFNNETGSGTVVDVMPGNKIWCIISYGINGWSENFGQKT